MSEETEDPLQRSSQRGRQVIRFDGAVVRNYGNINEEDLEIVIGRNIKNKDDNNTITSLGGNNNNNNNIGRNINGRIDDNNTINNNIDGRIDDNNNIGGYIDIDENETIYSLGENIDGRINDENVDENNINDNSNPNKTNLSLSTTSCYSGNLVKCIFTDYQVTLMDSESTTRCYSDKSVKCIFTDCQVTLMDIEFISSCLEDKHHDDTVIYHDNTVISKHHNETVVYSVTLMDSENNDKANVDTNNNEVGSNNNSLGDDNNNNSNLINNNSNQIGNNNISNTTTGNSTLATVCEDDDDTLVDLNLMCVMLDQGSEFEDEDSGSEYEDDVDSYLYNENLSIDTNDEWNIDKVIKDVAEESIIIVDPEESIVGKMHEVRMLHFGSVLIEKEMNAMSDSTNTSMNKFIDVMSTSTRTSANMFIDINNDHGIKFGYNNNIKMNDLRWSKLNSGVKRYKEVTRSNNNLKVVKIYDG